MKGIPYRFWCCSSSRRRSAAISTTTRSASPATRRSRRRSSPASQSDKIERVTVKSAAGEQTTVEKQGDRLAGDAAGRGRRPTRRRSPGITSNLASLEVSARGRRAADRLQAVRPRPGADRGELHVSGGKDQQAAARPEDADRQRPLRAAARQAARVPGRRRSSSRRSTSRTFDLRDKTILKIDRDKVDRVEIETPDRTVEGRQAGRRLADHRAGRRARRLRRGRRHHRPAEHHADESRSRRPRRDAEAAARSTASTSRPRPCA